VNQESTAESGGPMRGTQQKGEAGERGLGKRVNPTVSRLHVVWRFSGLGTIRGDADQDFGRNTVKGIRNTKVGKLWRPASWPIKL
jgi:hypothetical protein